MSEPLDVQSSSNGPLPSKRPPSESSRPPKKHQLKSHVEKCASGTRQKLVPFAYRAPTSASSAASIPSASSLVASSTKPSPSVSSSALPSTTSSTAMTRPLGSVVHCPLALSYEPAGTGSPTGNFRKLST